MAKRIVFDVFLFISIFIFPWWISGALLIVGLFIFKRFYEFIFMSSLVFVLYSPDEGRLISSPLFYSVIITLIYLGSQIARDRIILYKK